MNELELLHALDNRPRASITDLADILGTSEEDVTRTKEDLEKKKIICGYHTVINWDKTDESRVSALIEVKAQPEKGRGYDKVAEKIARLEEVTDLYLMSGNSEFVVMVEGKTMRQVAEFVGARLAPIDGVTATVTCFVLKKYKMNRVSVEFEEAKDDRVGLC